MAVAAQRVVRAANLEYLAHYPERTFTVEGGGFRVRGYRESDLEAFIKLYIQVLSLPPWNEPGTREHVEKTLEHFLVQNGLGLIVAQAWKGDGAGMKDAGLIGFSVAFQIGVDHFPFLEAALRDRIENPDSDRLRLYYAAKMAVSPEYRGFGVSSALNQVLVGNAVERYQDLEMYTLLRTHIESTAAKIWMKFGFENTGVEDPNPAEKGKFFFLRRMS